MTLLTAVALVTLAVLIILYLVIEFDGWSDRRESRRRNHARVQYWQNRFDKLGK